MSLFKKKKTFTNTDSASLYDPSQISDAKQVKKQAVKQWIFEGSQRPLHEYLLASSQNGLKNRWDRLYKLVQTKNIYSEYRWQQSGNNGTYSELSQLNWKKAAEEYFRNKMGNQVKNILSIDYGNITEDDFIIANLNGLFRINKFIEPVQHSVLVQNNPNYVVVFAGVHNNPLLTQAAKDEIREHLHSINSQYKGFYPEYNLNNPAAETSYIDHNLDQSIKELQGYIRAKHLHNEEREKACVFIKYTLEDYQKYLQATEKNPVEITGEFIVLEGKQFITEAQKKQLKENPSTPNGAYEWLKIYYTDKNNNFKSYSEKIINIRNHPIAQLTSKYVNKITIDAYPPIPIRVSNNDMDVEYNHNVSNNSFMSRAFLNPQVREEQLSTAEGRLDYDRTYAKEALSILGFDIKELISSFRDSVGNDWGKLDEVWIYLSVPRPIPNTEYDVAVLHKYWHLHHYMLLKHYVALNFDENGREYNSNPSSNIHLPPIDKPVNSYPYSLYSNRWNHYRDHNILGDLRHKSNYFDNYFGRQYVFYGSNYEVERDQRQPPTFDIPSLLFKQKYIETDLLDYRLTKPNLGEELYPYEGGKQSRVYELSSGYGFNARDISWREKGIGETDQIPVLKSLLNYLTKAEQNELLQYAMQLHIRTEETVKVYRDWVKPFVKFGAVIVGIAVAIATAGGDGGSTYAALVALAKSLAVSLAINFVVKIAVKIGLVSPKLAGYLQLIITVVMAAHGASWDFSKLITAPNIMTAVNQSFNAYNKQKAYELAEVYKQIQDETVKYQNKMEELQAKQQMVDLGVAKDAKLYLNMPSYAPKVNLFETPQMMYARHSNINVVNLSLGTVSNLADGLLSKQQTPNLTTVADIQQEVEDVLLIT